MNLPFRDWEQKTGFPMVVGAVDVTHIPIMQPYRNSQLNYSFKMKDTNNVQDVCDYNGKLMLTLDGQVELMMLKCFHTVQLTSTFKSKNSHIYIELYYLAETRLVCYCLESLLILFYLV